MEGGRDYRQLVRTAHLEKMLEQQDSTIHSYLLNTPLSTQAGSLLRPTGCPCSSRRSPSTSRSSRRCASRLTSVLLQLAGNNELGDEGCQAIAEVDLPRLQNLLLGTHLSTQTTTASGPKGASTFSMGTGAAYSCSSWVTL
jgi:hypothetical protein